MTVAAVVLAAGEASRFGSPKQRLLLPRVLERLRETSVDEIVVVEGAYALEPPERRAGSSPAPTGSEGQERHCAAVSRALGPEVEAAVVVLADGPTLAPQAIERVLEAWRQAGGVVAASYEGGRGHPLVIGRADWGDIPDEGLRDYPVRLVPCDDLGAPGDVDTEEDLRRL